MGSGMDSAGSTGAPFPHLGMFRKTMHWGFRSWILGVRSIPSHWTQEQRGVLENTCTLMASLLLGSTVCPPALLTTTRICLAKSLELPIRKSENAVCWRQRV